MHMGLLCTEFSRNRIIKLQFVLKEDDFICGLMLKWTKVAHGLLGLCNDYL